MKTSASTPQLRPAPGASPGDPSTILHGIESVAAPLARARVAVAVVHYRTYEELPDCLASLSAQTVPPAAVAVIDADGREEQRARLAGDWPGVAIMAEPNRGYAGGANVAVAWAERLTPEAQYFLVLNSDVRLAPDYLQRAVGAMEARPEAALATGKLLRPDGVTLDSAGIEMPRHRRPRDRGSGQRDAGQFDRTDWVFGASGAAMLIRRAAAEALRVDGELFDEDFFLYHEDTDLSWRAALFGWRVLYVHDAVAIHARRWQKHLRFKMPVEARRHSFKNHYLQIVKNEAPADLARNLPVLMGWEILRLGSAVLRDPWILPSYVQAARLLPKVWRKRQLIRRRCAAGPREAGNPAAT